MANLNRRTCSQCCHHVIVFIGSISLKYMEAISPITNQNQVENNTGISLSKEIPDSFIPASTQEEKTHKLEYISQNDNVSSNKSTDMTEDKNMPNQISDQQENVSIHFLKRTFRMLNEANEILVIKYILIWRYDLTLHYLTSG